jgi:hypothetical protein
VVPFVCALVGEENARSGDFFHLFNFQNDLGVHGSFSLWLLFRCFVRVVLFVCALVSDEDTGSSDFFHLFDFEGDDFGVHCSLLLVTGD